MQQKTTSAILANENDKKEIIDMDIRVNTIEALLMFLGIAVKESRKVYEAADRKMMNVDAMKAKGTYEELERICEQLRTALDEKENGKDYVIFLFEFKSMFSRLTDIQEHVGTLKNLTKAIDYQTDDQKEEIAELEGRSHAYYVFFKHLLDSRIQNA